MVGLAIVSHSYDLAKGVAELARGMAGPDVKLAATGGLDLPDHPLGTDANLILQAIEQVYSDDGVLVLMDLGSALLSAEMAREALPPDRQSRILLCAAPLVEGALAAAVQARLGSSLEQVAAEASQALGPKRAQLGEPEPAISPAATATPSGVTSELRLTVGNRLGLHARPAARFVQTAARFQSTIEVRNLSTGRGPVNAKSINGVATLGVRQGQTIGLAATGPDAEATLAAFQALAHENFGDLDEETPASPAAEAGAAVTEVESGTTFFQGLPASRGIAIGPARLFRPALPEIPTLTIDDPQAEWQTLLTAIDKTRAQIAGTREAVARRGDGYAAEIFEAHALFLDDEALRLPARTAIDKDHLNAAAAWYKASQEVAAEYRALDSAYMQARAADVVDVGRQVIQNLPGGATPLSNGISEPGILIAIDLSPADTARLDPRRALAICTAAGGPTSHSAILARTFGIPAVVGLGEAVMALTEGTLLVVDGEAGRVWPNPDDALVADYAHRAEAERKAREEARAASAAPAITRDGRRVEVVANIGSVEDALVAVESGAEGVGLFRTEFLFLDRQTAPHEEEQVAAYRAAAVALAGRPLIIRTLDVGGDKPLPYLDLGPEANPFLGWRAIRMCLAQPEFFKVQLRAIARVAAEYPVKVMFPMIATLGEWRAARSLLQAACQEAKARDQAAPERIETGIMVEVPSAALRAADFADEVDFFSIGTNDLSQYTLAAERGNARVAGLADAFQPAVLQLMANVMEAAHARGKWVGVCGEMGGDPLAVPLLVGLGVDELSMNPPAIPVAKQIIRSVDHASVHDLARAALRLTSSDAVRELVKASMRE